MSNISKNGKTITISDLLHRRKREVLVNVSLSKDQGLTNKALIRQPGFNSGFLTLYSKRGLDFYNTPAVTVTANILNGGAIGSIRVTGYTIGSLTPADIAAFKLAFATQYNINPNLIVLSFAAGSLIIQFTAVTNIDSTNLTLSDKSFFANADAVIKSIQPADIADFITSANITNTGLSLSGTATIDTAYTTINIGLDIRIFCNNDSSYNQKRINITNPFVGDAINDCMYTISVNVVVRINNNGTADRISIFPNDLGCRQIFINANSTFLIIPSNENDTTMPGAGDTSLRPSKVYLINISTGAINTITLAQSNTGTSYGYDKLTRKFYYSSFMTSNYLKLACVTIPSDFSSATLSPTYSSLLFGDRTKLEFVDSNTAYTSNGISINKFDIAAQQVTIIAGYNQSSGFGGWSNTLTGWNTNPFFNPFLDANNGANAFFALCSDLCYDSANQRLLVTDYGAHRIRTVDLRAGNNYAVTTLAGTSPLNMGLAINRGGSTVSQGVLDTLAQVGLWGQGPMPAYTKVTGPYLTSTFNTPVNITLFNNKIYFINEQSSSAIQLSSGYASDFSVVRNF